jgi:hypothetical protein
MQSSSANLERFNATSNSNPRLGNLVGHLMLQKGKSSLVRTTLPQSSWALREKA